MESTVDYLNNLSRGYYGFIDPLCESECLLEHLFDAMKLDGFTAHKMQQQYLRGTAEAPEEPREDVAIYIGLVGFCLVCTALGSGLIMVWKSHRIICGCSNYIAQGLVSLDAMEMTIKSRSGTEDEKRDATRVLPLISNHHLLLVTLMVLSTSASEALPIFLHKMLPGYLSIIVSVILILIFGDILPASILTGPNQLTYAAKLVPFVYFVMFVLYPIAYPMAKLLDSMLGEGHGMTMYNRTEITTLMSLQQEEGEKHHSLNSVQQEEVKIIGSVLKFREMSVRDVMTPGNRVYMLPASGKLGYKTLYEIFKSGFSRIPVYGTDRNDIVGLILAKDMLFLDPEDETPVSNFVELFGRKAALAAPTDKLGDVLAMFHQHRGHLAIVREAAPQPSPSSQDASALSSPPGRVVGIITLEDIVEEILGAEIVDETDRMTVQSFTSGSGATTVTQSSHSYSSNSSVVSQRSPQSTPQYRDLRLRLMHSPACEDTLSTDEVRAIVAHLSTNVPALRDIFQHNTAGLKDLVRSGTVRNLKRKSPRGSSAPCVEDVLYRRGKMSNSCTLVLTGKVTVLAGKDEFQSDRGAYSLLAVDALTSVEGAYIPDYTAFIASDTVRLVSLSLPVPPAPQNMAGGWLSQMTDFGASGGDGGLVAAPLSNRSRSPLPFAHRSGGPGSKSPRGTPKSAPWWSSAFSPLASPAQSVSAGALTERWPTAFVPSAAALRNRQQSPTNTSSGGYAQALQSGATSTSMTAHSPLRMLHALRNNRQPVVAKAANRAAAEHSGIATEDQPLLTNSGGRQKPTHYSSTSTGRTGDVPASLLAAAAAPSTSALRLLSPEQHSSNAVFGLASVSEGENEEEEGGARESFGMAGSGGGGGVDCADGDVAGDMEDDDQTVEQV